MLALQVINILILAVSLALLIAFGSSWLVDWEMRRRMKKRDIIGACISFAMIILALVAMFVILPLIGSSLSVPTRGMVTEVRQYDDGTIVRINDELYRCNQNDATCQALGLGQVVTGQASWPNGWEAQLTGTEVVR